MLLKSLKRVDPTLPDVGRESMGKGPGLSSGIIFGIKLGTFWEQVGNVMWTLYLGTHI